MKKILGIIFLSFLCSSFGTSAEINLECEPKAYGENNPIGDNNLAAGRKMNRRVQFSIEKN